MCPSELPTQEKKNEAIGMQYNGGGTLNVKEVKAIAQDNSQHIHVHDPKQAERLNLMEEEKLFVFVCKVVTKAKTDNNNVAGLHASILKKWWDENGGYQKADAILKKCERFISPDDDQVITVNNEACEYQLDGYPKVADFATFSKRLQVVFKFFKDNPQISGIEINAAINTVAEYLNGYFFDTKKTDKNLVKKMPFDALIKFAAILQEISYVYIRWQKFSKAEEYLQKSLEVINLIKDTFKLQSLNKVDKAELEEIIADLNNALAWLYISKGDKQNLREHIANLTSSIKFYENSPKYGKYHPYAVIPKLHLCTALRNVGNGRDYAEVEAILNDLINHYKNNKEECYKKAQCYLYRARLYQQLRRPDAISDAAKAVEILNDRDTFQQGTTELIYAYQVLCSIFLDRGKVDQAENCITEIAKIKAELESKNKGVATYSYVNWESIDAITTILRATICFKKSDLKGAKAELACFNQADITLSFDDVKIDQNVVHDVKVQSNLKISNICSVNDYLDQKECLSELYQIFQMSGQKSIAIIGSPFSGKKELLKKLFYKFEKDSKYQRKTLWVFDAKDETSLLISYIEFMVSLGIRVDQTANENPRCLLKKYHQKLKKRLRGHEHLLLGYTDIQDNKMLSFIESELCSYDKCNVNVLCTMANKSCELSMEKYIVYDVEKKFLKNDASQFIGKIIEGKVPGRADLVGMLGGSPFYLKLVSDYVKKYNTANDLNFLTKFNQLLAKKAAEIKHRKPLLSQQDCCKKAVLDFFVEKLSRKGQILSEFCSYVAEKNIPSSLLMAALMQNGFTKKEDLESALEELYPLMHLDRYSTLLKDDLYAIEPLLQTHMTDSKGHDHGYENSDFFVRIHIADSLQSYIWLNDYADLLLGYYKKLDDSIKRKYLIEHFKAILKFDGMKNTGFLEKFLMVVGKFYFKNNCFDQAIDVLSRVEKTKLENTNSCSIKDIIKARYYLAVSYLKMGLYEDAKKILIAIYADLNSQISIPGLVENAKQWLTAQVCDQLSICYKYLSKREDADNMLNEAVEIKQELLKKTADPKYKLGLSDSYELKGKINLYQGDFKNAKDCFEYSRDYRSEVYSTARLHPDTITPYVSLAMLYYAKGDLANALENIEIAKEIVENNPNDHDKFCFYYLVYARIKLSNNHLLDAVKYLKIAKSIVMENFGRASFYAADCFDELVYVYIRLAVADKQSQSRNYVYNKITKYSRKLGEFLKEYLEKNKEVASAFSLEKINKFCQLWEEKLDSDKSFEAFEAYFDFIYDVRQAVFGEKHPFTQAIHQQRRALILSPGANGDEKNTEFSLRDSVEELAASLFSAKRGLAS